MIIHDRPDFWYRGVMVDTSRHYLSMETLKKTIDALMMNKMNMLHWHITDDESFPLLLKSHPELCESTRYSAEKVYSYEDVREIVEYAKIRGVSMYAYGLNNDVAYLK